ncbi:GlsB/YeaQ/YmgE family stress response membrane protein [Nocardioides sp. Kera G14]|uniref:GlsB/YeaQ/YmgE family stress response membrane protein n=1 Tax=Nocardioides sp. Kera G14 TaxID=2884264 RepID=UPI001D1043CD|nr:hypothetical protein [Nocardioides sp. Kera G14]UDY24564.1 hypothetical protein LH076_04465 [Nocardioides sp. Kera G14]
MDVVWFIITTLIGGLIIGMLGKFVAPGGRDNISFLTMWVVGIIGMLVGSFLYWGVAGSNNKPFDGHEATWDNATNGIDWIRHLWQIVVTAVLVAIASAVLGRNTRRV